MIMNKTIMKCMVLGLLFAGCENGDKEFDDYEYQTISFATQTPIRTITLGEDVYPTEQDNEYRMQIIATLGRLQTLSWRANLKLSLPIA